MCPCMIIVSMLTLSIAQRYEDALAPRCALEVFIISSSSSSSIISITIIIIIIIIIFKDTKIHLETTED